MLGNFQELKNIHNNYTFVSYSKCEKAEECLQNKVIEKFTDGTYQPLNNHYYWKNYGCYKKRKNKFNSYLIVFGVNTDLDPIIANIKQDINRYNNQDDYEIITDFLVDNYGERIWDTCQVIELDTCKNINL